MDSFASGSFAQTHRVRGYDHAATEAFSDYASGTYFLRDQAYWGPSSGADVPPAPRAKIIHVNSRFNGDAYPATGGCSYEHGVCVIRGGR
jgi:hypothetical protein